MKEKHKNKKTNKQTKNKDRKEQRRSKAIVKGLELIFCAFKLGFPQLICQASLIFQSNLELALSIILKQKELYNSKHVVVECRCLKM